MRSAPTIFGTVCLGLSVLALTGIVIMLFVISSRSYHGGIGWERAWGGLFLLCLATLSWLAALTSFIIGACKARQKTWSIVGILLCLLEPAIVAALVASLL